MPTVYYVDYSAEVHDAHQCYDADGAAIIVRDGRRLVYLPHQENAQTAVVGRQLFENRADALIIAAGQQQKIAAAAMNKAQELLAEAIKTTAAQAAAAAPA